MTELFGRDDLLAEARAVLEDEGALCLVGPPGVGKSAVARALGLQHWVDLENVADEHEAVARIARVLGCPLESRAAVDYALSSTESLVLDAVGDLDGLITSLLESALHTRWVLTSRRRPELDASVLEVGPLALEPAVALLRASVRSPRQREQLDAEGLRALAESVDGVPLALELAAAQLRLFSPQELAARPLEGPAGQRLTDAVRRQLQDVGPEALDLLRRACVLQGTFDTTTLASLTDAPVETALLELLDHALLQPEGGTPPQFRLLRPIRTVVQQGTTPALREEVLARLAARWLPHCESILYGPIADLDRRTSVLDVLTGSTDPDTALRAALVLGHRDRRMGGLKALLGRADRMVAGGEPDLRVRWACMQADAHRRFSDPAAGLALLEQVRPLQTEATRSLWENTFALCRWLDGHLDEALPLATAAAERGTDPSLWHFVAAMRLDTGDAEGAVAALRIAIQSPDPLMRAGSLGLLGSALHEIGAHEESLAVLEAIDLAESPRAEATMWEVRGFLHADAGEHDDAQVAFRKAAALSLSHGERDSAAMRWMVAEMLEFSKGQIPQTLLAPMPYGRLLPFVEACISGWRAVVHATLGHPDAALAIGPAAVEVVRQGSPQNASQLAAVLAVAVAPFDRGAALELLHSVPTSDAIVRAEAILAGQPVPEPTVVYDWILAGVVRLQRSGVQIARNGAAFVTDTGERVDIQRRRVLQRVLGALAQADEPLSVEAICRSAWPGERLVGSSGTRRVHVAISTLRGLGLRSVLRTIEGPETTWTLDAEIVDAC